MKHISYVVLNALVIFLTTPVQSHDSIAVIGIGRLGLCAALCFEQAGYKVIGLDIKQAYVESINNKTFASLEPGVNGLLRICTNFKATCSFDDALKAADFIYITVDTPTKPGDDIYDHSKLNAILAEINKRKVYHKDIVISSTVCPGYIQNVARQLIKDCINTSLSYNPTFIAQSEIMQGLILPDLILIGEDSKAAGDIIEQVHKRICYNTPSIHRMNIESAEITKLAVNCAITHKIAFANEIGDIADSTKGADKKTILAAVGSDKRIGSLCLKPGYGFGGPCFPRDNRALGAYAKTIGIEPIILYATDKANKQHAHFMADQLLKENKELYAFESVTYKENCPVPIIEESQKLAVAALLAKEGKRVRIIDKMPVIEEVKKKYGAIFEYEERN